MLGVYIPLSSFIVLGILFCEICVPVKCISDKYYYGQKPQILSGYLRDGNIKRAQEAAETTIGNRTSYSGYFTTNEQCGNNLFAWFFPAMKNSDSAPLLLWLNGGPGSTSMFGLFVLIGPWHYLKSAGLVSNPHTWTNDYNVLFLDQPVGTGFSFTEKGCYAENLTTVVEDMYKALTQFFVMFPQLKDNRFFLTGESFAGHYLPALGVEIDKKNVNAKMKIKLSGIIVGNPVLDFSCNDRSNIMYQLGIVDDVQRMELNSVFGEIIRAINDSDYLRASQVNQFPFVVYYPNDYNLIYDELYPHFLYDYILFVKDITTRYYMHVGYTPFSDSSDIVFNKLIIDVYKSIGPYVEYLLNSNKYPIVFFTGQLDTVCSVSSVTCALRKLNWSGAAGYLNATRTPWYVSGRLAGWMKTSGNLWEVVFREAGHYVCRDQPVAALELIKMVVSKQKLKRVKY